VVQPPSLKELIARLDQAFAGLGPDVSEPEKRFLPSPYNQVIQFSLAGMRLGVPITHVQEIDRLPEVTPLPNLPEWVRGIFQIRGEILSLVDLRAFLGLPPGPDLAPSRAFVVLRHKTLKIGISADRILGLCIVDPAGKIPQAVDGAFTDEDGPSWMAYMIGRFPAESGWLYLLDTVRLLSCPRMNAFFR